LPSPLADTITVIKTITPPHRLDERARARGAIVLSPRSPVLHLRWTIDSLIIKSMRSTLLFSTMALGVSLAGCGIDGDLTCGFSTCAPAADAQSGDATVMRFADAPDAQASSRSADAAGRAGDGEAATDSSAPSSAGEGGGADDAAALGDGCVMCGLGPCCAPTHQCIASGTTCCANAGASCGGDHGSCCGALACTAARQCEATCVATGSCSQQNDCCLGTYCDTTLQCVACLQLNAACTQAYECCTGACRNSVCVNE
jgi:hypothetical protein